MKIEYINPFLQATVSVLKTTTDIDFKVGKPILKGNVYNTKDLVIMVGISGEIRGKAIIAFDVPFAKIVISKMMMGMPVDTIDDMAKSAISELANMIMGNSATLLSNGDINIDIAPPTLMIGENMSFSSDNLVTIGVPLVSDMGEIEFNISVKESA